MDNSLDITVGSRIATLRGKMTVQELSMKVGVSRQAITKWEKDIAQPRAVQLEALAKALGTTAVFIAFGVSDPDTTDPISRSIKHKLELLSEDEREHILTTVNLFLANKRAEGSDTKGTANGNGDTYQS